MKRTLVRSLVVPLLLIVSPALRAEVIDSAASGFTVVNQATINKRSQNVYETIVNRISRWWSSSHTFSEDARNLSIKAQVGGCFCEKLPGGGEVQHLEVIHVNPGRLLRMEGGLGPLQAMAVTGVLTFEITPAGKSTQVEMKYAVVGYAPDGLEGLASAVDGVLAEQLSRLKSFSETGRP